MRTSKQFALLRAASRATVGRYVVVRFSVPPPDGRRRVGIAVSRRFSRLAVTRNRARRLLREAYRRIYRDLLPAWVLLIPRRDIQSATIHQVFPEVRELCRRAGLLGPRPAGGRTSAEVSDGE
ncbi:MAG: ribonuclease P protein component [Kiritimatiellaeota bacterium]|nr:ribonuclease P protein component [Kiritimatiellota bacterium]